MDLVSSVNTFTSAFDDESANVILVDNFSNSISDSDLSETLNAINSSASFFFSPEPFVNSTSTPDLFEATVKNEVGYRDPLSIILPITICYLIIFVTGILGNVITCIVIAKNKTMHTATNYYLFNLAVSDFFVLIIGEKQNSFLVVVDVESITVRKDSLVMRVNRESLCFSHVTINVQLCIQNFFRRLE